jgi:hypothetical protein
MYVGFYDALHFACGAVPTCSRQLAEVEEQEPSAKRPHMHNEPAGLYLLACIGFCMFHSKECNKGGKDPTAWLHAPSSKALNAILLLSRNETCAIYRTIVLDK